MLNFITAEEYCNKVFDGTHETPKPVEKGYPLVTSKNITGFNLDLENSYNISELDYFSIQKRSKVSQWDILFSMIGSVGEVYLEQSSKIPYAIKNVGVFSCLVENKAKWLYYYLKSPIAQQFIKHKLNGAVQKFLPLGALRKFPVIPFSDTCNKAVDFLSALDAKIELNNRINTELEAMAKTLYDYWFVQFDFPDENGRPYKSSGGRMVWNEQLKRAVPEGWEVVNLGQLGKITGGSTPLTSKQENFTDHGIPWITPKDLSLNKGNKFIRKGATDVTEAGFSEANLTMLPKGSVLLSSRAPIGYLAISGCDVTTNQGFKSFITSENIGTEYLFYAIQNLLPVIENNASGSTFKEVSASVLRSIYDVKPEFRLIQLFREKILSVFSRQENLELENQHLSSLRDWLLPMLMNGQVRVS